MFGRGVIDYKFFCFNGKPRFLYCSYFDDNGELFIDYYDCNWKFLEITRKGHKNDSKHIISRPNNFENMKGIASELSKPFPFVRIDLFTVNSRIYFSEFTFLPTGGLAKYENPNADKEMGNYLDLKRH